MDSQRAHGEIYAFINCDLATGMSVLPELVIFMLDGYDLVTGSRCIERAVKGPGSGGSQA